MTLTLLFPLTPFAADTLVDATGLLIVLPAPVKGGTPLASINHAQYSGTINWQTTDGEEIETVFQAAASYRAAITLSAKTGYTLSGLSPNSFTHPAAQRVSFDIASATVTVLFNPTAGEGEDSTINLFDLSAAIPAPVYRAEPLTAFENEQYAGTVAWAYVVDGAETAFADGAAFDCEKGIRAVVTLNAKTGFTLSGIPADIFVHAGASGVSNAAGGGTVTLAFDALPWTPIVSNLSLNGKPIQICCYAGANRAASSLIDGTASTGNYWDYGWNGDSALNLSDWPEIMKDPLGTAFNGDECGTGHPTVFEAESVREAIRKRAHCFTIDLGAVTDNIVQVQLFPRDNGQRWPYRIEVFYSSDAAIGPLPGEDVHTLGEFDLPYPGSGNWQTLALYPRTASGRGFSARYIHIRIYKARSLEEATMVDSSFSEFRIGTGAAE